MRLRTIGIVAGAVIGLPVAALGVFLATFDANAYKPRIIETVRNATGRELSISGTLHLKLALVPTVTVDGVALANAPWGSRPQMASIRRAEASLALWPLLSGEVRFARILLIEPDILLERRADGAANWEFKPQAAPAASEPAQATSSPAPASARRAIAVEDFRIEKGRISLHDAASGSQFAAVLTELDGAVPAGDGPIRLDGAITWQAVPVKLTLRAGSLADLLGPAPARPWPIDATIETAGARLGVQGAIAEPQRFAGYALTVEASAASLPRLAPLLPDVPLPPLNDVRFAARIADRGAAMPAFDTLSLKVGESDLAALRPGLSLNRLEASAAAADQPLSFAAEAVLDGLALSAQGSTGPLAALLPGTRPAAWPIRLDASAGAARIGIEGALAAPSELAGLDARLRLIVPDLSMLSPLAGQGLPVIQDIDVSARLVEHARRNGFALRDLVASAAGGDLEGEVSLLLAQQSRIEARLKSRLIDADALMASLPAPAAAATAAPSSPSPPSPPPAAAGDQRLIPDLELPLGALKPLDAELALDVGELRFAASPYRSVVLRATLKSGVLDVRELHATLPEGTVLAGLLVDAARPTPSVGMRLRAPGLALAPLLGRLGVPFAMQGTLGLDIDVKGEGNTVRAVAATLGGHVGAAVGRGTIDSRLLDSMAGELWRLLVPGAPRSGDIGLTCLATRFDFAGGLGTARTLLFDTSVARVSGSGTVNLADERLALRLQSTLRLGGGGLSVPVEVGGSFARPGLRARPEDVLGALGGVAAGAGAGAGQGAAVGGPLGAVIGGIVGAARQGAGNLDSDACGPALAIARGASGASAPAAQPAPSAAPSPSAAPPASTAPAPSAAPPPSAAPAGRPRSPVPGVRLPRLPF